MLEPTSFLLKSLQTVFVRVSGSLVAVFTAASLLTAVGPTTHAAASTCPTGEASHPAGKAALVRGWVHTCGNKIVDSRGHVVRPDAVGLFDMSYDDGSGSSLCTHWAQPAPDSAANFSNWGFNSVLLYVSWANVESRRPSWRDGHLVHHYNRTYLRAVSNVVNSFASRGIKVVLAMANNRWSSAFTNLELPNGRTTKCGSGMPWWLYRKSSDIRDMVRAEKNFFNNPKLIGWFATAWKMVAHRFSRSPGVIGADVLHEAYDILAQPYLGSAGIGPKNLHLASFYERVGKAIHSGNRHLLIMTNEWHSWKKPGFWAVTRKPRVPNAVEIFEFYAGNWDPVGIGRMKLYRGRADNWHRPLWVEEFYAFLPTFSGMAINPEWVVHANSFLSYAKRRHIGWAYGPYIRLALSDPPGVMEVLETGF
jgi:Cellulase (glycosyl hydrolase family 5)